WNGIYWFQRSTSGSGPPGSRDAAMAFDVDRGVMVFFGGRGGSSLSCLGDSCELNGNVWTLGASPGPAPREFPALAYVGGSRRRTVLFGGTCTSDLGDTYSWNGTSWIQVAIPGPAPRAGHAMAFDSAREMVVLFGASSETWEFKWGLPDFTQQPQDQSSCAGGSVTFSVVAHGSAPLTYQWRRNG